MLSLGIPHPFFVFYFNPDQALNELKSMNRIKMTQFKDEQAKPFFNDVETLIFCDETKFYTQNGDAENAIVYLGVAVPKSSISLLTKAFDGLISKHRIKTPTFHSTTIFKERRPRPDLANDLTALFIQYQLHCFCFKYNKDTTYEATRINFSIYNDDIFDFNNPEFQALFYYVSVLNTYLRDVRPEILQKELWLCFDRNVYGKKEIEGFDGTRPDFIIKRMSHVGKDQIKLLAFPDFFGYMFRKAKQHHNRAQLGTAPSEPSPLVSLSQANLERLAGARLFHYLDLDIWLKAIH
jgi:hypothetical protein